MAKAKVFPIKAGAKFPPLVSGWQRKAKPRAEWGNEYIGVNWGFHCEGMLIVDIDPKNGGPDSLNILESINGDLPPTLTISTPSGGKHLYYDLPEGHPGVANRPLAPGIDIKSTGGYVVAPGSKIPAGEYKKASDSPKSTVPAPAWLVEKCGLAPAPSEHQNVDVPAADADTVRKAAQWIKHRPVGDEAYATACGLRDFGVSLDQAWEILVEQDGRDPSLLHDKVAHAFRYAKGVPGGKLANADDFGAVPADSPEASPPAAPSDKSQTKLYDFALEVGRLKLLPRRLPKPRRYVVPGWLPAAITAILAGHGGDCKSLIMLYLVIAIALGGSFFQLPPCEAGAVLIALGEEDKEEAERRLYGIIEQLKLTDEQIKLIEERVLLYACIGENVRLTGNKGGTLTSTGLAGVIADRAMEHAKACGFDHPALVGLDHMLLFNGGEVVSNEDAGLYAQQTGYIVARTGATVLTVAHSPKGGGDDKKLDQSSVLGAVSAVNLARLVLLIQRMTPSEAHEMQLNGVHHKQFINLWLGKSNYTKRGTSLWLRESESSVETAVLAWAPLLPKDALSDEERRVMVDTALANDKAKVLDFVRREAAAGTFYDAGRLEDARVKVGMTARAVRAAVHAMDERELKRESLGGKKYRYIPTPAERGAPEDTGFEEGAQ